MNDNQSTMTMSPAAWGMLVLLSIVWGGTFFFQEIAVRELPVFTIVAIRDDGWSRAIRQPIVAVPVRSPTTSPDEGDARRPRPASANARGP